MFVIVLTLLGLVMYAYFANLNCDPLASGQLGNGNEVLCVIILNKAMFQSEITLSNGKIRFVRLTLRVLFLYHT